MYHRWLWPLVASVTAIIIITLDTRTFAENPLVRGLILSAFAGCGITAFGCLFSLRYRPLLAERDSLQGGLRLAITVRGNPAAGPKTKEEKEALDQQVEEAYQILCTLVARKAQSPGAVTKMMAERELHDAQMRILQMDNDKLRMQAERQVPELVEALKAASQSIRSGNQDPPPLPAKPSRAAKRAAKKVATDSQLQDYPEDGHCDWCDADNRRLIRMYGVSRGRNMAPVDMNVCRDDKAGCQMSSQLQGGGSLSPTGGTDEPAEAAQTEMEPVETS